MAHGCAILATLLGAATLHLTGASSRAIAVNLIALPLGWMISWASRGPIRVSPGVAILAAALAVLGTAVGGVAMNGARRWVMVHGLALQPGAILLPAVLVAAARLNARQAAPALLVAVAALALQPDRALAGVAVAGTAGLAAFRRGQAWLALALAAAGAFAVTLARPDALAPVAHVEGVFADAVRAGALATVCAWAAAALMIAPVLPGLRHDGPAHAAPAAFAASWSAMLLAALLGPYPTPVIGSGASAVLGYALSLSALFSRGDRPGGA